MNKPEDQQIISLAEERTLSCLLEKSAQLNPMEVYLQDGIETLIGNLPYLNLLPKGGIFVAEGQANKRRLRLVANYRLGSELHKLCQYVDFGHCLCGKAAQNRKILHTDCIDEQHETSYPGIAPHGHYNVPIVANDETIGLIVLYLPEGHPYSEQEKEFLLRVSHVFSLGINLRQTMSDLVSARHNAVKLANIADNSRRLTNEFLINTSLKVREPINGILGLSRALLNTQLDAEQKELVEAIIQNGGFFNELTQEFRDFSDITSEAIRAKRYIFNMRDVIQNAGDAFLRRSHSRQLSLQTEIDPALPVAMNGSPKLVERVLANLLNNAIAHSPAGATVRMTVRVDSRQHEDLRVIFSVENEGAGIPVEMQRNLFQPFHAVQADNATRGLGIGLFICKELLDLVEGNIWVESEPGRGSKFYFALNFQAESE